MASPMAEGQRKAVPRILLVGAAVWTSGIVTLLTLGVRGPGRSVGTWVSLPPLDMWIRWDAGWYRAIAENGYYASATEQSPAAFFPLYPLILRALLPLADVFVAGVLVTLISGVLSLLAFRVWAELRAPGRGLPALSVLLVWPFAYYLFGAVYSDALFLLLALSAFLSIEKGRPELAALFGALATATRPLWPALVLGLLVRQLERTWRSGEKIGPRDFLPLLSITGLVAYMAYLHLAFGDALAWLHTQAGWGQKPGPASWFKIAFFREADAEKLALGLFHAALIGLLLAALFRARRVLGLGYCVYAAVALAMPLVSSRDFIGLGRYALAAFPAFLAVDLVLADHPRVRKGVLFASFATLLFFMSKFATGRYVA